MTEYYPMKNVSDECEKNKLMTEDYSDEMKDVSDECVKNKLDIFKTVVTHLQGFEIKIIRVIPFTIASIDIEILTNHGHIYRTVNLAGDDYIKWSNDDGYLFTYIRENIDTIF